MADTKQFEYVIRDKQGKLVKGRLDAANQAAVVNRLKSMNVAPLSIHEVANTGLQREIKIPGFGDRIGLRDLSIMARQLATMINAGIALLRALAILSEQTENKALAKVLTGVRGDVETGSSFSAALVRREDVFPPLMINMVKAGEVGGFLDQVLLSIADNFEAEVKLRSKIKSAMAYPVVVFFISILGTAAMLLFIVPIFADMFTSMGSELPLATQVLVNLSDFLKIGILPIIAVAVGFAVWWGRHKNDRKVREVMDPWKLKIPVFGGLFQKIAISRFTRNFGAMLHAGVPILQALEIVGDTSGNIVVERATRSVQDSVRQGQALAAPLAQHPIFPSMVVQMMAVGEDTGALDTMLDKVADFYDQEVEATTDALTSLIEPIMIVLLGSLIGGMVIAMYLPIFSIYDVIS